MKENEFNLKEFQIKNIKQRIYYIKFIDFKIKGKYKECLKILFDFEEKLFSIKNFIIFLTPGIILKKIFWYYQK